MYFNIESIKNYKQFIAKKVNEKLEPFSINANHFSIPVMNWLFYLNRSDMESLDLNKLLGKDQGRGKFITGSNIIDSDLTNHDSSQEEKYYAARDIIDRASPFLGALAGETVFRINQFSTPQDRFESISDPKTFGQFYFNMKRPSPMGWAEIIVHEASHQYLFMLTAKPDFKKEFHWDKKKYSSLRKEDRPLIGILHALIAQCSMIHLAHGVLNNTFTEENKKEALELIERLKNGFYQDISIFDSENGFDNTNDLLTEYVFATKKLCQNIINPL